MSDAIDGDMGHLPKSWEVKRLSQIADLVSGGTPSKANLAWWQGTVPWVSPKDMKVPRLYDVTDHITEEAAAEGSRIVPAKTIFLVIRGMILANDIPIAITERPMAFNQDMKAILPHAGIDPDFLFYAIRSQRMALNREISTSAHGTRRMGTQAVEGLLVPMPSNIAEQNAISKTLMNLESAIEVQDKTIAALRELKSSTMELLFERGVDQSASKSTQIGNVPVGWSVVPIDTLVTNAQYGLSIRGEKTGKYPILRMNCQQDGRVLMRNLQYVDIDKQTLAAFRLKDGDLLFNRTNSYELVGRTALFTGCDQEAVFASYLVRLTPNALVCPRFLNYYLNLPSTQTLLKGLATRAIGQSNISASKLKSFLAPLPGSIQEQNEISDIIDELSDRIIIAEEKRREIKSVFASALHALLSGSLSTTPLLAG